MSHGDGRVCVSGHFGILAWQAGGRADSAAFIILVQKSTVYSMVYGIAYRIYSVYLIYLIYPISRVISFTYLSWFEFNFELQIKIEIVRRRYRME